MVEAIGEVSAKEYTAPIFWLASYPKSGSTWLKVLLHEIIAPSIDHVDAIPSIQKVRDVPVGVLHTIRNKKAYLYRTHCDAYSERLKGFEDRAMGAIYIYRHPADVFLSALNYAGVRKNSAAFIDGVPKTVDQIITDGEIDHYAKQFVKRQGVDYFTQFTGPLSTHMLNWHSMTLAGGLPWLSVKYEDMVENPASFVRMFYDFFGVVPTDRDVDRVVKRADHRTRSDGAFFWKRKSYNFLDMLPSDIVSYFEDALADLLQSMSYERFTP